MGVHIGVCGTPAPIGLPAGRHNAETAALEARLSGSEARGFTDELTVPPPRFPADRDRSPERTHGDCR